MTEAKTDSERQNCFRKYNRSKTGREIILPLFFMAGNLYTPLRPEKESAIMKQIGKKMGRKKTDIERNRNR